MRLESSLAVGSGPVCQDCVGAFVHDGVIVAVVADGAGGTSGGRAAAQLVVERVQQAIGRGELLRESFWRQVLSEIDVELEGACVGQTTAVVAVSDGARVCGASVGDSVAWRLRGDEWSALTEGQVRKPLLGGGGANPKAFTAHLAPGDALLLATDGLASYARAADVCEVVRAGGDPEQSCARLVELVRLPGGRLPDDVGIVLLRNGASLEQQVCEAARAFRSTGTGTELARLIEPWISSLCPAGPWRGRWYDGAILHDRAFEAGDVVRVAGWISAVADQSWHPFELRLELAAHGLAAFDVRFGDRVAHVKEVTFLALGTEREWLFRFHGPMRAR